MSTSFSGCEADLGKSENNFYNDLWKQAAGEGITPFVSSGDSGAAGCDAASESEATGGRAVNGLASTPYNVAVGGTEFNEGSGTYWSSNNGPGDVSAISYIPEVAWNESGDEPGGSDLWSTGGGASTNIRNRHGRQPQGSLLGIIVTFLMLPLALPHTMAISP